MSERPTISCRLRLTLALAVLATASCASTPAGRAKGGLEPVPGLSASQVDRAARPRKVALLIGVDRFDDAFWPELLYAAKDARDLAKVLGDPARGGFDEIVLLTAAEDTTRSAVQAALVELAARAPRADDTLVVYLSSHGTLDSTPRGLQRVLVLRDTRHDDLTGTALDVAGLVRSFDALPSMRKVLVLATCHSGSGKSLLTPETLRAVSGIKGAPPALESISHASLILSAAEFGQPAREDDGLRNDVYTHYLLEALSLGADANGDGAITATEAHDHARRRTYEFTEGRQVPTVQATVVGADPVILAGRVERPGLPVLYSYASGLEGYTVSVAGRAKGVLPGNVVLDQGEQHIVIARGSDVLADARVRLEPGERLDVQALIDRGVPRWAVGVRGGGFALLDPGVSGEVMAPVAGLGLFARARDLPWPHIDPQLDLSLSYGRQEVRPGSFDVRQDLLVLQAGGGVAGALGPRWLRGYAGPHLALLLLDRTVRFGDGVGPQRFATVMPGGFAGVGLELDWLELQLEAQLHYLPLVLDGEVRSVATASMGAGAAFRF